MSEKPSNASSIQPDQLAIGLLEAAPDAINEAIRALAAERPDIVVCDVHLDEESGTGLWSYTQTDPGLATMTFAFRTATSPAGDLIVDDSRVPIIRRPIEPSQLLEELAAALGMT
jgi:CheY-like chemotaxis protein